MSNESVSFDQLVLNMRKTSPEPKAENNYQPKRRGEELPMVAREEPRPVGRPAKARKLDRTNSSSVTVFADKLTKRKLDLVKLEDGLDIKDVMLAATVEFLDRHYNGERLTESGREVVRKRIAEILDRL